MTRHTNRLIKKALGTTGSTPALRMTLAVNCALSALRTSFSPAAIPAFRRHSEAPEAPTVPARDLLPDARREPAPPDENVARWLRSRRSARRATTITASTRTKRTDSTTSSRRTAATPDSTRRTGHVAHPRPSRRRIISIFFSKDAPPLPISALAAPAALATALVAPASIGAMPPPPAWATAGTKARTKAVLEKPAMPIISALISAPEAPISPDPDTFHNTTIYNNTDNNLNAIAAINNDARWFSPWRPASENNRAAKKGLDQPQSVPVAPV